MHRTTLDSWAEQLGITFLVLGVKGLVHGSEHEADPVRETSELLAIDHQFGGSACLQETVTGVVFRLADATSLARKDLRPLFNGLATISDSFPEGSFGGPVDERLSAFGYTGGQELDVGEFNAIIAEYLPLPAFTSCHEAFAQQRPFNPRLLAEWPVWSPARSRPRLDETLHDQLIAASALSRQPLGLYLLWRNSD